MIYFMITYETNLIIYRLIFSVVHFQVQHGHQKPIIVFYLLCLPFVSHLSVHPMWQLKTVPEFSPISANVIKPLPKFSLQPRRKWKIGLAQLATKEPISGFCSCLCSGCQMLDSKEAVLHFSFKERCKACIVILLQLKHRAFMFYCVFFINFNRWPVYFKDRETMVGYVHLGQLKS